MAINTFVFRKLWSVRKMILFLLLNCHSIFSEAQELARMYIVAFPANAYIELDGQRIHSGDSGVTTSAGIHRLKVWLPEFQVVDSVISLSSGSPSIFRIYLKYSPEFISYHKDLAKYKFNKFTHYLLPVSCVALAGALWLVTNIKANKFHNDARENEAYYSIAKDQGNMDYEKKLFEENRKKYKFYKAGSYGFAGLATISIVWTIRAGIRQSKIKPPVFKPN